MIIPIVPVAAYPNPATQLRVDDGLVQFNVTINCQYALLDADGNLVSSPARASLTSGQYADWTSDDVYVANCIAQNLGLTPA